MDETDAMELGPFIPTDINRGDRINAMIKDHKLAKHTANASLSEVHESTQSPAQELLLQGVYCLERPGAAGHETGSFRVSTFIVQRSPCTQEGIAREST
jgi:hypothetical protein